MLAIRSPLIMAAPLAGLVLAAVFWLTLGGPGRPAKAMDALDQRVAALLSPRNAGRTSADGAAAALARPLFSPDLGKVSLRLDGVSRSPRRAAALLSINGGAPQWVLLGSTVSGATLVGVSGSRATVETAIGRQDVRLGETVGSAPAAAPPAGSPEPAAGDTLPPGVKLFPPASAPGAGP